LKEQETAPPPDPADIFRYTFKELPDELALQMKQVLSQNGNGNKAGAHHG